MMTLLSLLACCYQPAVAAETLRQPSCKKLSKQEKYQLRYGNSRIIYSIQYSEMAEGEYEL